MGRKVTVTFIRLQVDIHQKILDLRSVEATILKPFFERLWDASTDKQKEAVLEIVGRGDKEALNFWMETHKDIELGEMSHNKLKRLGQRLQVRNYSRLDRRELEDAIMERREACNQDKK